MEPLMNAHPSIWCGLLNTRKDTEIAATSKSNESVYAFDTAGR